ncbi:hypothetical protein E4K10_26945 [Streptomyces sp. T1317-0309]|nr:hypothetical protein E4K10_26945 [Streptomyces sp. T1317-0309]
MPDGSRALARLQRALLVARVAVRAASDHVTTHRGAVHCEARTRLAEAERRLHAAESTETPPSPRPPTPSPRPRGRWRSPGGPGSSRSATCGRTGLRTERACGRAAPCSAASCSTLPTGPPGDRATRATAVPRATADRAHGAGVTG